MAKDAPLYGQLWMLLALIPMLTACSSLPYNQQPVVHIIAEKPKNSPVQQANKLELAQACQGNYCGQDTPNPDPILPLKEQNTALPAINDPRELALNEPLVLTSDVPTQCPNSTPPPISAKDLAYLHAEVDRLRTDLLSCTNNLATYEKAYLAFKQGLSSVENALLTRLMQLSEQDTVITSLQMALLEREAQLQQITLEQQATIQEMVRTQAKLRSRNSRAETATLLAEVTITIKKAKGVAHPNQSAIVERSQQLLAQANDAFQAENYDSASFLARQGISGIQGLIVQNSYSDNTNLKQQVDQLFAIPLNMRVIGSSPMRSMPSNDGDIIVVLEPDAQLTAIGYKGTWVKVVWNSETRTDGWVFYNLLELQLPQDEFVQAR